MPRLPTKDEARAIEEARLDELWDDVCSSPEIYRFTSGARVQVCACHTSPHFHLLGGECSAVIAVNGLTVIGGDAPCDALAEARKWAGHPTNRQALCKEWERLKSLEDSGVFFEELGHKIPATLSMRLRIRIAQAMVGYCYSVKCSQWADPNLMREAKRLVRLTRGQVDKLSKRLRNYDPKLRSVSQPILPDGEKK